MLQIPTNMGKSIQLDHLTDTELIHQYQIEKNPNAIGALYKRYIGLVYGLSYKYLQNHHQAEDCTTEIFCLVMEKLKNNKVSYFKSWLYIVCKNYVLSILRKNKGILYENIEEIPLAFMESDDDLHLNNINSFDKSIDHQIKLGIESLKEAQKVCIELFYIQEKSYAEVSDMTGFELNQVKSHIQNGKRNLKIFLESNGYQNGQ